MELELITSKNQFLKSNQDTNLKKLTLYSGHGSCVQAGT